MVLSIGSLVGLLGGVAVAATTTAAAVKIAWDAHELSKKDILSVSDIAKDTMLPEANVHNWIESGALKASLVQDDAGSHYEIAHDDWIAFIKKYQSGEFAGKDFHNLHDDDAVLLMGEGGYKYNGNEELRLFFSLPEKDRKRLAFLDGLSQNTAKINLTNDRINLLETNRGLLLPEGQTVLDQNIVNLKIRVKTLEEQSAKIKDRLKQLESGQ